MNRHRQNLYWYFIGVGTLVGGINLYLLLISGLEFIHWLPAMGFYITFTAILCWPFSIAAGFKLQKTTAWYGGFLYLCLLLLLTIITMLQSWFGFLLALIEIGGLVMLFKDDRVSLRSLRSSGA